jgi:DNA-directed RNA polymerase subunit N (RpoN/RPB10)
VHSAENTSALGNGIFFAVTHYFGHRNNVKPNHKSFKFQTVTRRWLLHAVLWCFSAYTRVKFARNRAWMGTSGVGTRRCMIAIRCYTCNKPLAMHWPAFDTREERQETARQTLDQQGLYRMCCRTAFITYSNPTHDYLPCSNDDVTLDTVGTTLFRKVAAERTVACYATTTPFFSSVAHAAPSDAMEVDVAVAGNGVAHV